MDKVPGNVPSMIENCAQSLLHGEWLSIPSAAEQLHHLYIGVFWQFWQILI